jgi:hypothetical protein
MPVMQKPFIYFQFEGGLVPDRLEQGLVPEPR